MPHGLSNALVLPHVLRFNMPDAAHLYAECQPTLSPACRGGRRARPLCRLCRRTCLAVAQARLETRLRDVKIGEEHLEKMAADAMKQARLLVNNPRAVSQADALAIYHAAW